MDLKKYFDVWSIMHFGSGVLLGILFILLELKFSVSFILTLTILTIFEVLEPKLYKIFPDRLKEVFFNQIMDIIIGLFGFLLAFSISLKNSVIIYSIIIVLFLFVILPKRFNTGNIFNK